MKTYLQTLRHGLFNLIHGDMISHIASQYGEWSNVEVSLLQQILRPDDNVVEVGANIGMHAVPIAKSIPQGRLICFEPQRIIFQQLCCNLSLNNLTNVEPLLAGGGEQLSECEIEDSTYDTAWNYGSFSLNKGFSTEGNFTGATSSYTVPVIPLDACPNVQRLNKLALLKIDAEGFDGKVLRGAKPTIAQFEPTIFIEYQPHTADEILSILHEMNYQAFWCASERYQANNFNRAARFEQGVDINFIAFPQTLLQQIQMPNGSHQQNLAAIARVVAILKPAHIGQYQEIPLLAMS